MMSACVIPNQVQVIPYHVNAKKALLVPDTKGTDSRMSKDQERIEREARAERLRVARHRSKYKGPKGIEASTGINVNSIKAHEQGRNGFGIVDARKYAEAFNVSLNWLFFGQGDPSDTNEPLPPVFDVPLISWISAGELDDQQSIYDLTVFKTVSTVDLPEGDWIALRVEGPSMNKISPPESIIFVNLNDKRLVTNACYVISDERGRATYKRYRPSDDPPFQPVSFDDIDAPKLEGAIRIIGRVRRSTIDM